MILGIILYLIAAGIVEVWTARRNDDDDDDDDDDGGEGGNPLFVVPQAT